MVKKTALVVCLCVGTLAVHGGTIVKRSVPAFKQKMFEIALPDERRVPDVNSGKSIPALPQELPMRTLGGTYTGITGFFDFQLNAGACQYIRVDRNDPSGNTIHVIYMTDPDSTVDPGHPSRGTYYVYSTNGGSTWDSFGSLRVPDRRSGYPSLDMLQGSIQGTIIANHNNPGAGLLSLIYVDSPPGGGAFSELGSPNPFGGDDAIWPGVAGAFDGSVIVGASRSTASTWHLTRTPDFISWSAWTTLSPAASAGSPVKANGTGRVSCLVNTAFEGDEGIFVFESTDNGATWPASGQLTFTPSRIAGPDTFWYNLGSDMVYNGDALYLAAGEANVGLNAPTDSAQITFWSQATGFVPAATKVNTAGVAAFEHRATLNTTTLDMPSIGMSGNTIVIAYHAMMENDTSVTGYNNCDIFIVQSNNGGATWSVPRNVSNSPGLDDRFVSVSPWNSPGAVNLVWQEDIEGGCNIIGDPEATVQRTRQVFLRTTLTGVEESNTTPASFTLAQNYPNPFNPSTVIEYYVPQTSRVTLKVYNLLGEEVAALVNQTMQRGAHQATFNASSLPSGMYVYQLKSGLYTESKKMLLLK